MTIPKTGYEKADHFAMALEDLRTEGREWSSLSEIALQACTHDDDYMRRRQVANKALRLIGINRSDIPDKPPVFGYRGLESSASVAILENAGLVESAWSSPNGAPLGAIEMGAGNIQKLYRLVPEQADIAELAETPARRVPCPEEPYMM